MKTKNGLKITNLFAIAAVAGIIGLTGCMSGQNQNTTATNRQANVRTNSENAPKSSPTIDVAAKSNTPIEPEEVDAKSTPKPAYGRGNLGEKITKANFDKIDIGMSRDEVTKIFDDKGMQTSEMHVNGKDSDIFMWASDDFSKRISVTFEKEKVTEKTQKGL